MGAIVGERFVRAANVALEKRCPLILLRLRRARACRKR